MPSDRVRKTEAAVLAARQALEDIVSELVIYLQESIPILLDEVIGWQMSGRAEIVEGLDSVDPDSLTGQLAQVKTEIQISIEPVVRGLDWPHQDSQHQAGENRMHWVPSGKSALHIIYYTVVATLMRPVAELFVRHGFEPHAKWATSSGRKGVEMSQWLWQHGRRHEAAFEALAAAEIRHVETTFEAGASRRPAWLK